MDRAVNLYALLPLFRVNPYDGGFYIAKASTVSRDPEDPEDFGKQNVGVYRVQVHGPRTISVMTAGSHDLARHIRAAEAADLPLPIAVMIGNHPTVTLFGGTALDHAESEYAAAVGGAPIRLATAAGGLDVTGVLTRERPIFENIWLDPRWGELDTLIGLNTSVPLYAEFPEVVAVNAEDRRSPGDAAP